MVTELRSVSYGKTWFYSKCNGKPLVDLKQKKDTVQFFLLKQSLWQLCIEQTGRGEVRSLWKSQDMMMASREDRNTVILYENKVKIRHPNYRVESKFWDSRWIFKTKSSCHLRSTISSCWTNASCIQLCPLLLPLASCPSGGYQGTHSSVGSH